MMDIFWVKFSEDSGIPDQCDAASQLRLNHIFDEKDAGSPWSQALAFLHIKPQSSAPVISWVGASPYMNWSYMTQILTGGLITLVPDENGGAKHLPTPSLRGYMKMIKRQWDISLYTAQKLAQGSIIPNNPQEAVTESLALGLCIVALTARLKGKQDDKLDVSLSRKENRPRGQQKTLDQIEALQRRRTRLSPAWLNFCTGIDGLTHVPPHYWNTPPVLQSGNEHSEADIIPKSWKGLRVAGDEIVGKCRVITALKNLDLRDKGDHAPIIAVFARARPETVEIFPQIAAALYGEGGALSHAATIAREMNLPCITALGSDFVRHAEKLTQNGATLWVRVDPHSGTVHRLDENDGSA